MRALAAGAIACLSRGAVNGPAALRKLSVFALGAIDNRYRVATPHGSLTIRVSNPLERWRADTLYEKEPDTIDWLERTIAPNSLLYDIGANIGLYTLYAAHKYPGQTRVVAFEPEALNFARLYQNIFDNGLAGAIGALSIGLGSQDGLGRLVLSSAEAGRALHAVAGIDGATGLSEWLISSSLDRVSSQFGERWNTPTHLKIDVDGPEIDILEGAFATLRKPTLRHVLIELSGPKTEHGIALMSDAGFELESVGERHGDTANHIFVRARNP